MRTLSGLEKETIFLFNEAKKEASVYTYNEKLKAKLEALSQSVPEQVRLKAQDKTGAVIYQLPKTLISIRKPCSEDERKAARERALERGLHPPKRTKAPK